MEHSIDTEPIEQSSDSSMDIDGDSYLLEFLDGVFDEAAGNIKTTLPSEIDIPVTCDEGKGTKDEVEEPCCICMDTFDGARNTTLKCGHKFHTDCILGNISSAASNKHKCPLCRDEMCPEISVKEVDELKGQMGILEDALHEKHVEINHYRNAVWYFYDETDELYKKCSRDTQEIKQLRKQSNKYFNNLRIFQEKLSKEIVGNKSEKKYRKCSFCDKYGHNVATCCMSTSPRLDIVIHAYTDHTGAWKTDEGMRPSSEIVEAIMPGGELYDAIDEHFE